MLTNGTLFPLDDSEQTAHHTRLLQTPAPQSYMYELDFTNTSWSEFGTLLFEGSTFFHLLLFVHFFFFSLTISTSEQNCRCVSIV